MRAWLLLLVGCATEPTEEERIAWLLQPSPWPGLRLELDHVGTLGPRYGVAERVAADLALLVDKPDGVEVVWDDTLSTSGSLWTEETLEALAAETFDAGDGAIHVLWLDGAWAPAPERTLALALDHAHLAVFADVIEAVCTEDGTLSGKGLVEQRCSETERVAWTHELGHVLGLVDDGLPMLTDHADPEHPRHDVSEDCLMHYAYEGAELYERLRGEVGDTGETSSLFFDEACLADLAAVRDGPTPD